MTKADKMEDPTNSSFIQLIMGEFEDWQDWQPALGWWPLRLRSTEECGRGMGDLEIKIIERALFSHEGFQRAESKLGVKFGVEGTRKKLYEAFAKRVISKWVTILVAVQG
jgi:hypothetical protein